MSPEEEERLVQDEQRAYEERLWEWECSRKALRGLLGFVVLPVALGFVLSRLGVAPPPVRLPLLGFWVCGVAGIIVAGASLAAGSFVLYALAGLASKPQPPWPGADE
ncbi:MAG: hypothetical protein GY871_04275 [Actinomycetales bacterium]|nr:hypothetical protein [Actinomycetales bacterium]